jgi:hypothetical protein
MFQPVVSARSLAFHRPLSALTERSIGAGPPVIKQLSGQAVEQLIVIGSFALKECCVWEGNAG